MGKRAMNIRNRAFTLIEILVVIVILSVASAAMVPLFLGNTDYARLKDSTTRLGDMMRFCQSMAVFQAAPFRLNVDRGRNQCWVSFEKNPLNEPGVFSPYRHSEYGGYKLQEGVRFGDFFFGDETAATEGQPSGEEFIEFRKDGTADQTALVVEGAAGDAFTLMVSGLTGQVFVVEGAFQPEEEKAETTTKDKG